MPKSSQTTTSDPWKPAQRPLKDIIGEGRNMWDQGGFRTDPYEGQRVAGFSGDTESALGRMASGSPVTQPAQGAFNEMLSADPYRDMDRIRGNVTDDTKAALASTFGGAMNSGLAQDTYGRAIGDALANVEYGAWGDQQNRKLNAMSMAPSIQGMGYRDINAQLGAGGMRDDLAQRNINADMGQHYEEQGADAAALERYSAMMRGMGGMGGTKRETEDATLGGTLGSIGSFLQFSDRRLKTNIRKVGETPGGANLYDFSYIWDVDTLHTGVMADEVPHAIAGTLGGFSVVDYARVT